jgi:hypothetical protein
MQKATSEDKKRVIDLLTWGSEDNKGIAYFTCQNEKQVKSTQPFLDYAFEICFLFGEIWLSDDRNTCALIWYPHRTRITLKSVYLTMKLIVSELDLSILPGVLHRDRKIKSIRRKVNMAYLWHIGATPAFQHQETYNLFFAEVLQMCKGQNLPVYVETADLKNLEWYESFGFNGYGAYECPYFDQILFFLKWDLAEIDETRKLR